MSNLNLIMIGFSFLCGMLGYIITFVWIRPIIRYSGLKKQIFNDLKPYIDNDKSAAKKYVDKVNDWFERHDGYAKSLSDCFKETPFWYKIWLAHKKESPIKASEQLTKIGETAKFDHTKQLALLIKELLRG